jgi:hypothetical protein
MLLGVGAIILLLALLGIGALLFNERSVSSPGRPTATAIPTEVVERPAVQPEATEELATLEATAPATSGPTDTSNSEFVRIGSTGGLGAFIRRDPRAAAPGIVARRDGTILKIVGPDVDTEGRTWRHVQDQQGNDGWTPRDFLLPSESGF